MTDDTTTTPALAPAPALAFPRPSTLSPTDDARLSRIERVVPRMQSGAAVYSGSASSVPSSTAVLPSGQISPLGIAAVGNLFPLVVQGQFGFGWDGTTLTIAWDGTLGSVPFVLRRTDRTNFSVPRGRLAIDALQPKTQYQFAAYIAVADPTRVSFVAGDAGSPRFAFSPAASAASLLAAAQQQRLTVNESLTTGLVSYTTGDAGTQTTGGGSGTYTGADTGYSSGDPNDPNPRVY